MNKINTFYKNNDLINNPSKIGHGYINASSV